MRPSLESLSAAELTARLAKVLASERSCVLESLHLFIEMERRETHKQLSHCNSLFAYCVEELHLSEGYTFRRLTAARLLAQFPAIDTFIRDGSVSLSNLTLLKDVLTQANHLDVLRRATHLSKQRTKELVAELMPRPDVAPSVRKLPSPTPSAALPLPPPPTAPAFDAPQLESPRSSTAPVATSAPPPPAHSHVNPLSPGRYLLKATISAETKAKLEKVQAALSHVVPDGNLEDLLDEALSLALDVLARQHRTAAAPKPDADVKALTSAAKVETPEVSEDENSRYLPADLKRDVRIRDEDCCTFVGANGKRCRSTHQLQFHHKLGYAKGGPATRDNITLHCRAHNIWQATLDYGADHMARYIRSTPSRTPLRDAAPHDCS